ncbi:hypothetical protein TRP8649_00116 [Pelagimonas phthalicica]|uniref:DUF2283 domain-containing protein n=1 Tax=Pelagimonas phthalicica TaxID=1037362 RepID=A0A238J725_9RHOB|nr:hypothetical protein [Pelagimonas phthalicica]TDS95433.1 hypothetical protein CLV87_1957 [Pelagimonas phthalicica]SMX26044.1 hypothetical protein TRP8649_00116 [Pelagimonas phthalicica]
MKLKSATELDLDKDDLAVLINLPDGQGEQVLKNIRLSECSDISSLNELRVALQNSGEDFSGLDIVFDVTETGRIVGIEVIR